MNFEYLHTHYLLPDVTEVFSSPLLLFMASSSVRKYINVDLSEWIPVKWSRFQVLKGLTKITSKDTTKNTKPIEH